MTARPRPTNPDISGAPRRDRRRPPLGGAQLAVVTFRRSQRASGNPCPNPDICPPIPLDLLGQRTTMSYMGNITVRIPDALRKELDELCRRQQRPASEIVRDSLRRYIAVERFQSLRRKALPFAEAQGLLTDEDIFKVVS